MRSVSGKEFAKVRERNGWQLVRVSGSDHIFKKAGSRVSISVPIHAGQDLRPGLLSHFLKQAGLTEADLK